MKSVLFLCAVIAALGCNRPTGAVPQVGLPEVLRPLEGAVGSKETLHPSESAGITYTLQASYPASSVISAVGARAVSLGWEPLKEDYFRPGSTTSLVHGWSSYRDSTGVVPVAAYVWQSCWRSKGGAYLRYTFRYRSELSGEEGPPPAPNNSSLSVVGEVLEPAVAKFLRNGYRSSKVE